MNHLTCTAAECDRPHMARGYCDAHYRQFRKNGRTQPIVRQGELEPIEDRFERYVIRQDGCWGWSGKQDVFGYSTFCYRVTKYAHRVGWEILNGPVPEGLELDHVCRNRSCVNPDHLRPITRKQNQEHRKGAQRNNKSTGVLGVNIDKRTGKYKARVRSCGKTLFEKCFDTLEEAEAAVIEARNRHFTHNDVDRVKA